MVFRKKLKEFLSWKPLSVAVIMLCGVVVCWKLASCAGLGRWVNFLAKHPYEGAVGLIGDLFLAFFPFLAPIFFKQSGVFVNIMNWLEISEREELLQNLKKMIRTARKRIGKDYPPALLRRQLAKYVIKTSPNVSEYNFNYILEGFVEEFSPNDDQCRDYYSLFEGCRKLLESYFKEDTFRVVEATNNADKERKIAFSCFYLLSLICKKIGEWNPTDRKMVEEVGRTLERIATNKAYSVFARNLPLYHEVRARWLKRSGRFMEAVDADKRAIDQSGSLGITNHALYASYVSSVCKSLEQSLVNESALHLGEEMVSLAYKCERACRESHPEYAKYHYLGAKLRYVNKTRDFEIGRISRREYVEWLCKAWHLCYIAIKINDKKEFDIKSIGYRSAHMRNKQEWLALSDAIASRLAGTGGVVVESISRGEKNHRSDIRKPNEDVVIADRDQGIYIVMDGITRPHDEYAAEVLTGEMSSAAIEVASCAASTMYEYIRNCSTSVRGIELLRRAAQEANKSIRDKFGREAGKPRDGMIPPGAVGIVAHVEGDRLYYLSMGDCGGVKISFDGRNYGREYFGRQNSIEASMIEKIDKRSRYADVCNSPRHRLRYAIFDGLDYAVQLADAGYVSLSKGDVVYLYSDGMERYFRYSNPADIAEKDIGAQLEASKLYDKSPYSDYADDKSVIQLNCN